MKRRPITTIVIAACFALTACGVDDSPEPSTITPTDADNSVSEPAGGDVVVAGRQFIVESVTFEGGAIVTVRNVTDAPIEVAGWWMCNRPSYAEVPTETVGPDEILQIDAAGIGLAADGGEFALYSTRSFDDAGAIVAYVAWGDATHGRLPVAVEGGVWTSNDVVDNDGRGFVTIVDGPSSPADYEQL